MFRETKLSREKAKRAEDLGVFEKKLTKKKTPLVHGVINVSQRWLHSLISLKSCLLYLVFW